MWIKCLSKYTPNSFGFATFGNSNNNSLILMLSCVLSSLVHVVNNVVEDFAVKSFICLSSNRGFNVALIS